MCSASSTTCPPANPAATTSTSGRSPSPRADPAFVLDDSGNVRAASAPLPVDATSAVSATAPPPRHTLPPTQPDLPQPRVHRNGATPGSINGSPTFTSGSSWHSSSLPANSLAPSPCERLSRPRTTTGPPLRPWPSVDNEPAPTSGLARRRSGRPRTVPMFTTCRSTSPAPSCYPDSLATPTPQPFGVTSPGGAINRLRSRPPVIGAAVHCIPGPYPPGLSRFIAYGTSSLVPLVQRSRSLTSTRTCGTSWRTIASMKITGYTAPRRGAGSATQPCPRAPDR